MNDEAKEPAFKVVDKRHFTEEGDVRSDAPESAPEPEPAPQPESKAPEEGKTPPAGGMPALNFMQFVLSLASSVQMSLGLMPNPTNNLTVKNLQAAQQTIDILAMLQDKTKGNLDADEEKLMQELMYTLRMQFVEASKAP